MDRASPEPIALLKSLKPYPGGNDQLRALQDLDIMDKHQALIGTSDMIGMPQFLGGPVLQPIRFGPLRDGMTFPVEAQMDPYVRIGGPYNGTFSMYFPLLTANHQAGPLGGKEIVPALMGLANAVDSIVESFADLYR